MKKNLLIAASAVTLGLGILAPLAVSAQSNSSTSGNTIVDKIATRFHLNKTDVQKVFDEDRAAKQAEREQAAKDELAALVKAGTITQAQADKITAKRAEMKADMEANRTAMQSMTAIERKAAMDAKKTELEKWATDNGIDIKYVMPGHMGEGPMGGGRMGGMPDSD